MLIFQIILNEEKAERAFMTPLSSNSSSVRAYTISNDEDEDEDEEGEEKDYK